MMQDLEGLLFRAAGAVTVALLIELLLRRIVRRLPLHLTRLLVEQDASHPDPAVRRAIDLAILPVEVALWVAVVWFVTEELPVLHAARDSVVRALAMGLAMPLFATAERSYTIVDLLALPIVLGVLWIVVNAITRLVESRWILGGTMQHGGQRTVGMLVRYALTFLGTVIVLQAWGIDVRTLAIAGSVLGVGIGFGLQNLANNFVSGLVISLERPIKPGDYVRIGEFQGTVERIGARSTEIVTSDLVSILVPNSKLLEQEVVSWTHGDPTCRITVAVGVAYGSNVALVRRALIEAARSHPRVIADRPPDVDLASFGDSALNFELDVWIREPRLQNEIISDLNFRIEAAFRRHGIEIAFPQRDLRLRSPELAELVMALTQRHFTSDELAAARASLDAAQDAGTPIEDAAAASSTSTWTDAALDALIERMRGPEGVPILDRRHRLRLYPRCFTGRDAVSWLARSEGIARDRAVELGRLLIERNLVHHVLDEHTFHDDTLFYRFRADD
jgi:potassium efflux system protein